MSTESYVLSRLAAGALRHVAEHPGACGTDVRDALGIHHLSQASRLLARLERAELISNKRDGGRENRWSLTELGSTALGQQHATGRAVFTADAVRLGEPLQATTAA